MKPSMKGWLTNMDQQKLLIDTNVILDFLLARQPFDISAKKIFSLAAADKVKLYISINSFTDIIYFVHKEYDTNIVRKQMNDLLNFVTIIYAGHKDAVNSLKMTDFNDIEDAFQAHCAEKEDADFIITRDLNGFKNSNIPAVTPDVYLQNL
jgi:predicted nucleic acid-binding protein